MPVGLGCSTSCSKPHRPHGPRILTAVTRRLRPALLCRVRIPQLPSRSERLLRSEPQGTGLRTQQGVQTRPTTRRPPVARAASAVRVSAPGRAQTCRSRTDRDHTGWCCLGSVAGQAPSASETSELAEWDGLTAFARHRWSSHTRPTCTRTVETNTIRARKMGGVAGHRLSGKCPVKEKLKCQS